MQDFFLGAEVDVERRRAQPGLGGDVPGGGGVEAAFGERRGGGEQDAARTRREVVTPEEAFKGRGPTVGSRGGIGTCLGLRCCLVDHGMASSLFPNSIGYSNLSSSRQAVPGVRSKQALSNPG